MLDAKLEVRLSSGRVEFTDLQLTESFPESLKFVFA